MKKDLPRILIGGANSGCGKTSITCGILKALTDRGMQIQSYKCGPDYIDPMLHSHITGRDCRNLDPFFSTGEELRYLMSKDSRDADFSLIEGVMGYYDGIGVSCEKSTHTVSVETGTPTILIFNVKGMAHTMIPLMEGMIRYQENPVVGVILNRCSKGLYQMMKPEIERILGIRCVGYFPYKEGMSIGSRHLGLMTAAEIGDLDRIIEALGETAAECIDLDQLIALGVGRRELPVIKRRSASVRKRARIALAWDKAFCFYYKQNLEILEDLGAELVRFSPVEDAALPPDIQGIYLGGGYPESYKHELAMNQSMKESIKEAVDRGAPLIAECGGFMYTCDHLVDLDGTSLSMLGLIPADVFMTGRLSMEFGYVRMETLRDTAYFPKGLSIPVHEFHYSRANIRGDACRMVKHSGKSWQGVYVHDRILAGYPHLYFLNCMSVAERFLTMAEEVSNI